MGKVHDALTPELKLWIAEQKIFFVATAPLSSGGHLNCSPKGGDSFRIVDDRHVAYVDYTGSGIETIAHLQENGRVVIMFCAFDGPPKIVRLHGRGSVIYPEAPDFQQLLALFPTSVGARAIVRTELSRVSDSCGFSVPLYEFVGDRDAGSKWAEKKGAEGLEAYRKEKNARSLDGLPGYLGI